MSAEEQVQETASSTFNVFRRLSRPRGRGNNSASVSFNGQESCQEVVADSESATRPTLLFKPAAFKRLKSQLGKRRGGSKEKRKAVELSPSLALQNDDSPIIESIPQPTDTTDGTVTICDGPSESMPSRDYGGESQNIPSGYCGQESVTENDGSTLKEPIEREESDPSSADDSRTMSTANLAHRIHDLLSLLPSSYKPTPSGHFLFPGTSNQAGAADAASADSIFLSLLSSASVMNGSISKGRESVWAALERLKYSPHPHPKEEPRESGEDIDTGMAHQHEAGAADDVDMASVMICCPLQPTEDTEVEIARSEVVSIDFGEVSHDAGPSSQPHELGAGMIAWSYGKQKGNGKYKLSETIPLADKALPPPPPKIKEVRVWYPSRIKVSFQAFWWGYRIYLPPPVMRVLSDKSLEAAKRAAMITAALTWLVSHFPTGMLPPPMRAVVGVIKQIVPIMGYVGGFIAWSWNTIQGFDKGQGVTLSATWLLPIALVPGTWFYVEPPESPNSGNFSRT